MLPIQFQRIQPYEPSKKELLFPDTQPPTCRGRTSCAVVFFSTSVGADVASAWRPPVSILPSASCIRPQPRGLALELMDERARSYRTASRSLLSIAVK